MKNIQIKYVNETFKDELKPKYVTPNQFQVCNFNPGKVSIRPGQSELLPIGLSIFIPKGDLCGLITMHPALASEGGLVYGGTTVLPAQYEKPISIRIENHHPTQMLVIEPFAPIAMVTLMPTEKGRFVVTEKFKASKDDDKE